MVYRKTNTHTENTKKTKRCVWMPQPLLKQKMTHKKRHLERNETITLTPVMRGKEIRDEDTMRGDASVTVMMLLMIVL